MNKLALTVVLCVALGPGAYAQSAPPAVNAPPAASTIGPSANTKGNHANADQPLVKMSQDPDQWVMPAKNYASTRFSRLKQINRNNIKNLQLAWTFSGGVAGSYEDVPIVVGDTMYVITPYPNKVFALDLKDQGRIKWSFNPHPDSASQGAACCGPVNRGVAYAHGKIFFDTLDDHVIALDAKTGKKVWDTQVGSVANTETMTMAPLVVGDHVFVGNSGGEEGVRGWLKSLDTATGKVQWVAYSTGPDKDVLIGKDFHPYYDNLQGKNLGATTWPSKFDWMHGAGAVWGWVSYDPKLNLVYYGTSNPSPWNAYQRKGRNLWTAAMFARNPDTGEASWAYQFSPHDMHDFDGVNSLVLFDIKIDGKLRDVVAQANRNGYMYIIDRKTGQVISATPFMSAENVITNVNLETGMPHYNPDKQPGLNKMTHNMCPAQTGATDWEPMAYSPVTKLLYIPRLYACASKELYQVNYIAGTPYVGDKQVDYPGPGGWLGGLQAWNPATGKAVWMDREPWQVWSGVVATAGDVVFYGTLNRWFKAVDAKTGALLWKFRVGSGIVSQPMTYAVGGRQYVAVWAGSGKGADPYAKYAGQGGAAANHGLGKVSVSGGTLYVFALPKTMVSAGAAK